VRVRAIEARYAEDVRAAGSGRKRFGALRAFRLSRLSGFWSLSPKTH